MPDPMDTVARCAPSAEAAEHITRVAARVAYFDGACGMLTMPEAPAPCLLTGRPLGECDCCDCRADEAPSLDDLRERGTCSGCLARTWRVEECVCEDGGDAEDVRDEFDARRGRELGWWR